MLKIKWALLSLLLTVSLNNISPAVETVGHYTTPESIKQHDLRNIFEGKQRRWETGIPVRVFILPPEHIATRFFAWQMLHIAPEAWNDIKNASVANSQRTAIQELQSELDMIRYISLTPGAIGYINNTFMVNKNGSIQIINIVN